MKNLLIILSLCLLCTSCGDDDSETSCTDGILNGSETGVDCGGDCGACDRPLEGIYRGLLTETNSYNGNFISDTPNTQVALVQCSDNCIEVAFITAAGTATAPGTFVKASTFYTLDLSPVYEDPDNVQSWEENWPRGSGTYDWTTNELTISVQVAAEHANGGTDAAYFFQGKQN